MFSRGMNMMHRADVFNLKFEIENLRFLTGLTPAQYMLDALISSVVP